jgi:hypothetical protein
MGHTDKIKYEWENKIALMGTEIERLTLALNEKNRESEQWRVKIPALEKAHLQEMEDMKKHMDMMRKSMMVRFISKVL